MERGGNFKGWGNEGRKKRDFRIDQQIAITLLCNTVIDFQTPLSFYATQIVNSFLNPRISANHDKG